MRTARAQYHPDIRNAQTVKRRPAKTTNSRASVLKPVPRKSRTLQRQSRPRRRTQPVVVRPNGLGVFSLLAVAAAGLALLFVLALNWQRQAYQFNQNEVALRSKLDQTANERRLLVIEKQRALSPRENELRSRQVGLFPFKLEERTASAQATSKFMLPNSKSKTGNPSHSSAPAPVTVRSTAPAAVGLSR